LETRAEDSPKQVFEPLIDHPAPFYLDKYCPDLFWMLKENKPFYRGMRGGLGVSFVDLTKTTRKSENTSNWYTEIFDNHFEMEDFPKRSKSLICTTDSDYAHGFGGQVYIVLPVKNAKIGEVLDEDMWEKTIDLFGNEEGINEMNKHLANIIFLGLKTKDCSFRLLQKFDRMIKDEDGEVFHRIQNSDEYSGLLDSDEFVNEFLETILKAYSPHILGLQASTPATYTPYYMEQEVWFDTGAIIVPQDEWEKMRNVLESSRGINNWQDLLEAMKNEI
jgi:hypothetical protein